MRAGRAVPASLPIWSRSEDETVELARFRLVDLRHEVPVAIERRLDRGVTELRLDVLRMRPLGDQEARVRVAQVVEPDAPKLGAPQGAPPVAVTEVVWSCPGFVDTIPLGGRKECP